MGDNTKARKEGEEMNLLELPKWGINGKNYAFMLFLDNKIVSIAALNNSEKWELDETDTEIIGRN